MRHRTSHTSAVAPDTSVAAFYANLAARYDDERRAIAGAPPRVSRAPGSLRITARNGHAASLVDAIAHPDSQVVYFYTQFLPSLDAHLIKAHYYEGWAYALVSDSTGRITDLAEAPVIAPSGGRFVVASLDLDANYNPNTIQIWRMTADSIVQEFAANGGEVWGPDSAAWLSPDTVRFVRTVRDHATYTDTYLSHLLVRHDSGWAVEPPIP